jgi:hypothetical protein
VQMQTCRTHLFLISLPSSTAADGGLPAASPAFSRSWSLPCPGRRFLQHDTPMRPKCTKNRMPNKPLVIHDSSTIVVRHSLPGMAGSDSLAPLAYTAQDSTTWDRTGSQRDPTMSGTSSTCIAGVTYSYYQLCTACQLAEPLATAITAAQQLQSQRHSSCNHSDTDATHHIAPTDFCENNCKDHRGCLLP